MTRINELVKMTPLSRIREYEALPDSALIRLYSYQGIEAFHAAKNLGYWTGSDDSLAANGALEWQEAYDWIRDQLKERSSLASGDRPIWAWFKRPSTKPKPKKYRGTGDDYRITFQVPKSRILLSDYETWHSPLNQNPFTFTEKEFDDFCERWPQHCSYLSEEKRKEYFEEITKTWHHTLEFTETPNKEIIEWLGIRNKFRIQACVDRIYPHEILEIRKFEGNKVK